MTEWVAIGGLVFLLGFWIGWTLAGGRPPRFRRRPVRVAAVA